MNYQLVGDSSVDLTDELEKSLDIQLVAFTIQVEGEDFVDKDRSQIQAMREAMNASKKAIKTSCPSPYDYQEAFNKEAEGFLSLPLAINFRGPIIPPSWRPRTSKKKTPKPGSISLTASPPLPEKPTWPTTSRALWTKAWPLMKL